MPQNQLRNKTVNPQFTYPRNQSQFLGKVVQRFEDNVDDTNDKPRNYKIKFNILGLPEFTDEWPVATLLGNSTRPVEVDETVKIYDICDIITGMHTFFYEPVFEDRFTGIKNYNNEIDMTEKNVNHIKLPNCEITLDRHSGSSGEKDQDDLDDSKGSVVIKLPGLEIEYSNDDEKITSTVKFEEDITIEKKVTKHLKDDLEFKSDKNIKIESGAKFDLKAGAPITINATGSIKFNFTPNTIGLSCLPNCLFTGVSHVTSIAPCS